MNLYMDRGLIACLMGVCFAACQVPRGFVEGGGDRGTWEGDVGRFTELIPALNVMMISILCANVLRVWARVSVSNAACSNGS